MDNDGSGAANPPAPDYDALVASRAWQADLGALNRALADALDIAGAAPVLNGNLFYGHLQPGFATAAPEPGSEAKRRTLFEVARRGRTLFEIGVNGGHSLLLAKSANHALRCIGLDIARQVDPAWARVDIYVPVAMAWLDRRFPGDFRFIVGDSRLECPRFAVENAAERIDILHVDGAKETYFRDIVNLLPLVHRDSLIVVDDTDMPIVRTCVGRLVRAGLAELHPDFPVERVQKYQHVVLRPVTAEPRRPTRARRLARKALWTLGIDRRLPYSWRG